ncbi:Acriflavin resistance protein [hydrothermal vent metagenome]|uniref:Acriflavin resistance protein n=1 Tax=hydrothermal vent metagenome TaxID=652676 RepID=A0A3B0SQ56_9ZZZZ
MAEQQTSEKKKLLSQLKIDRDEEKTTGFSLVTLVVFLLLAFAVGTGTGMYILPSGNDKDQVGVPVTASVEKTVSSNSNTLSNGVEADAGPRLNVMKINSDEAILDASGYITARRMATVSAELTGRITEVLVEEGMKVERGQILARLDDAIAKVNLKYSEAQLKSVEARIKSVEAGFIEAKRVFDRISALESSNFSSEAQLTNSILGLETAKAEMVRVRADVDAARLEVARQQERLDDHTIRAPFSGVVIIKNAQPGEIVSPGSAGGGFTRTGICTIVDMTSLEIEADVNEAYIGRIFSGQRVKAKLDAYPDWTIPASVIAIIPTANRAKATVRVRIKLEVTDSRILPDMGIKITFYKS